MFIPLEDSAADIVRKAMLGQMISTKDLVEKTNISLTEAHNLRKNKITDDIILKIANFLKLSEKKLIALKNISVNSFDDSNIIPKDLTRVIMDCGNKVINNMKANAYIFHKNTSTILFDCGMNSEKIIKLLSEKKLSPIAIFLTHLHFDHAAGIKQLVEKFPQINIFCFNSEKLKKELKKDNLLNTNILSYNKTTITFPDFSVSPIYTPGHTEDSLCFLLKNTPSEQILFSGDALFKYSLGGCLPQKLKFAINNIKKQIFPLQKTTIIAPGHGPFSTIFEEIEKNPFF